MVEEVMGAWRQLHNVELHNLYSSFCRGGGGFFFKPLKIKMAEIKKLNFF